VLSSGLLHSATGGAIISPTPTGQGVLVHSADPRDGVSVRFDNAWGGGVAFDASSLIAGDGLSRSVSCAFAPWQDPCAGLPENCGVTAVYRTNGDGTVHLDVDSPTYAGDWMVTTFNADGTPAGVGVLPVGGTPVFQVNCGPGKVQVTYTVWQYAWNPVYQQMMWSLVTYTLCIGIAVPNWDLDPDFSEMRVMQLTPIGALPPETFTGLSSCKVTSEGIPELLVSDAQMCVRPPSGFDPQLETAMVSGGPGSIVTSSCLADAACCEDCDDREDTALRVSSAAGGGPRVLSVAPRGWLGVDSTGAGEEAGLAFSQACTDCTDQTTTVALHDDNGQSISFDITSLDASQAAHAISFDFGQLGATNLVLRAFAQDGTEVTPPGGTPIVNRQVFNTTNNPCPPGTIPTWTTWYKPGHGWITSFSCWVNTNIVLPGGTVVTGVHSISIGQQDALTQLGSPDQCDIVSSCDVVLRSFGPSPITGTGPTCDSIDFNNDSSFFDPQDIDAFLSVFSEGPCIPDTAACNDIDFNNDNSLFDPCDIESFLVQFAEGPCTPCGV
jgi:hypothetical protein